MAGAFVLLAGIWAFQFLWFHFPRLVNRETVSYVVFGVLTTVVNIVAYQVCFNTFPMTPVLRNTVSNTIAWVLAVVFAYAVNKLFVFQSKTTGIKALLWEAGKFVGARLLSYAVDMAGNAFAGQSAARQQRPVQGWHERYRYDYELFLQQMVYFQGS